jgi:hypothetical protein
MERVILTALSGGLGAAEEESVKECTAPRLTVEVIRRRVKGGRVG